jgi:hypothetical protein
MQAVVPVVIAGNGENRPLQVAVGPEEVVVVVERVPGGIDDVADDVGEADALLERREGSQQVVLRVVPLAGVAEDEERDLVVALEAPNRLPDVGTLAPLGFDPALAFLVRRVTEPARDLVVPRVPQRPRSDPGELLAIASSARAVERCRIGLLLAAPAGCFSRETGGDDRLRSAGRQAKPPLRGKATL